MNSPTFFQLVSDMAETIKAEGLAGDRDRAAMRLLARGYQPRMIAAFLDLAIAAAQSPRWADPPVAARETFGGLQ